MSKDEGFIHQVRTHTRNFFTNWSNYDGPIPTKVVLTFKNRSKALFSRAQCCGNHGQPGC